MITRMSMRRAVLCICAGAVYVSLLSADDASIARGKYLVDEVARCGMCHTPADANGQPDATKYLKGGAFNLQPVQAVEGWHKTAPDLTSTSRMWQRWGDAGFAKFLETAAGPTGGKADAPMPAYKLSHEDAQAIVDYLHSLK
jgi:mono/diheme cytochrome c family protein